MSSLAAKIVTLRNSIQRHNANINEEDIKIIKNLITKWEQGEITEEQKGQLIEWYNYIIKYKEWQKIVRDIQKQEQEELSARRQRIAKIVYKPETQENIQKLQKNLGSIPLTKKQVDEITSIINKIKNYNEKTLPANIGIQLLETLEPYIKYGQYYKINIEDNNNNNSGSVVSSASDPTAPVGGRRKTRKQSKRASKKTRKHRKHRKVTRRA